MKHRFCGMLRLIQSIVIAGTLSSQSMAEEASKPAVIEFDSFANTRSELLSRISGASKRVWLSTNFLTDAEVVSSLYIAQYRKVNVSVLIGKDKATHILSRLGYLKQVNIPVAIKPKAFYSESPTMVLIDDRLYGINSDIDYLSKARKFTLREWESGDVSSFETSFQEAAQNQETPEVKPLPLVGGQRTRKSRIHSPTTEEQGQPSSSPSLESTSKSPSPKSAETASTGETGGDGVYRYRRVKERPASGVPTKLPKMTLGQELERQRSASGTKPTPTAAGTP